MFLYFTKVKYVVLGTSIVILLIFRITENKLWLSVVVERLVIFYLRWRLKGI